ncbi:MAG: acetamidase/formamidase family protein [Bryobacterales bacterium]|nr:acetamidase/formamidase family protein [Bryobacterales bacterium]
MQRITRDKLTPVFDRRLPPVAWVAQQEVFLVETEDSRGGRARIPRHTTPEYLLAMRAKGYHGNPVTGPVYVEGAMPGDALAVHILEQTCDSLGYMGYWPFLFHLEEAARQALREMLVWIEERTGMSRREAYLLAGCVGDWRPGQVQIPNDSMRCIFPKQYLRSRP